MVDAGFENQKELTKMQLDNQKEIAEMQNETQDRKSGSAGMPRPISYAVFCLKKKKTYDRYKEHLYDVFQEREFERTRVPEEPAIYVGIGLSEGIQHQAHSQ